MDTRNLKNRIKGLDLIKVIAIIWIVLAHIIDIQYNGIPGKDRWGSYLFFYNINGEFITAFLQTIFNLGGIGVYFFYIASGFGLSFSIHSTKSYFNFIKRRFLKFMPSYYLLLLFFAIISLLKIYPITLKDFFYHIILIHVFFKDYVFGISAPLLFIGVIFQLYLLFPLLYKLSHKIHPWIYTILIFLLSIFSYKLLIIYFPSSKLFTDGLFLFSCGILIANYLKKNLAIPKFWRWLIGPGIILISILAIIKSYQINLMGEIFFLIFAIAIILIFLAILSFGELLKKGSYVLIKYLSKLSYYIYLTHFTIILVFFKIFNVHFLLATIVIVPIAIFAGFLFMSLTYSINQLSFNFLRIFKYIKTIF